MQESITIYDKTPLLFSREKVDETTLINRLSALEGQRDKVLVFEGIPSVSTLRELAQTLPYEVIFLVSKDLSQTFFNPGDKSSTLSDEEIEALNIGDYLNHTHNHPEGNPRPSPGDMLHQMKPDVTYVIIAKDGVTERMELHDHINNLLYKYSIENGLTPWRDETYDAVKIRDQVTSDLTSLPGFSALPIEKQQVSINQDIRNQDFIAFSDYYADNQHGWRGLVDACLLSQNPPIVKFFAWEEEEAISNLIRGRSYLKPNQPD